MSGVVTFDAAAFVAMYPAFAAYNTAHATGLQCYFDLTALYINNLPNSNVKNLVTRKQLLWLCTAHLAQLSGVTAVGGEGSTAQQVGRVSQGAEGTVSASFDAGPVTNSQAWWMQTQYGAMFWQATANWRGMRYVAPRRC